MLKSSLIPELQEISLTEMHHINGGGEADDLAYNITYVAVTTNPIFWLAKYNAWVIDSIF